MDGVAAGNTAWVLAASALVLFMTPGLGFFYGGLARNKNVLGTIMQSFIIAGARRRASGSSSATRSPSARTHWGLIGSFDWVGLHDVGGAARTERRRTYGRRASRTKPS